jgi:hypothetical protein
MLSVDGAVLPLVLPTFRLDGVHDPEHARLRSLGLVTEQNPGQVDVTLRRSEVSSARSSPCNCSGGQCLDLHLHAAAVLGDERRSPRVGVLARCDREAVTPRPAPG